MNKRLESQRTVAARGRQRGVVLLFSLIALAIMLIVAVALVRSFNSSLFSAGNIAFKRDLQNQSERAVDKALTAFKTIGALDTPAARAVSSTANNYSASMLPTNAQGIPNALQSDTTFAAVGDKASNDFNPAGTSVNVRYVIDRLCATDGDETTAVSDTCRLADNPVPAGTSLSNLQGAERSLGGTGGGGGKGAVPKSVLYRLSIKVSGPRNTQSFFQSTFTAPSS